MKTLFKVSQQTIWQLVGKIISTISTFFILGLITRIYGEEGTGIFTLTLAYLAFFFLAADLGLNAYILPKLTPAADEANKLFGFRLVWSCLLVILANVIALFLPNSNPVFIYSVFFGSFIIILSGVFNSTNLIFQKNLRYDQSIIASSVGSIFVIPVVVVLSSLNSPIVLLILGPLAGWVVNNLVAVLLARRLHNFKLAIPPLSYPFNILKEAWPISAALFLNTVYFRLDSFIISAYHSFVEVGIYNVAYQVFQTALVIPTFIMNSYYPIMLQLLEENKVKFIKQLKVVGVSLFGLSLIGTLFTWILAPTIIQLLSGTGFEGSEESLRILSLSFPAFFLTALIMWLFISLKKYKLMLVIYSVGLIFNIILNLIFIPQYSYYAASWATVLSEYLILSLQLIILKPLLFRR